MLSYPIDEAEELLASKLAAAKQSFANCEEDLDFLREQITVILARKRLVDNPLLMHHRLWRWLQRESTIGMSQ